LANRMNIPLSCIVIDDSDLDRKSVENEVNNSSDLKLIGSFDNCIEALSFFNVHQPDILFVDIDMPDINGLEFIRTINNTGTVNVIISSHPEYALEGFLLKVFDFILKPLETDRFDVTVKRILDFTQLKNKAEAYDVLFEQEDIVFKDGLSTIKLDINEILYLEAFGDYTKIVTDKKVHLTLTTLSKFVESLPLGKFVRIHRSYAVLKGKVNEIGNREISISDKVLPIGKTYYKSAKKELSLG
jgi:DNA-binding LytR/AlgR family response regulator